MRNLNREKHRPAGKRLTLVAILGVAALVSAGCNSERDENDGEVVNAIVLDPDVVLGLYCEDVGVYPETCVLDDPANPFSTTTIFEFNEDDPDGPSKYDIANDLPPGPAGAKSRFYFWATALARRPSGENQYWTALALHELFNANSNALSEDELIREQALKAYRSVLDNFFGSVLVFSCFECGADASGNFPQFAVPLNERVADHLFRTSSTATDVYPDGLRRLVATEIGVLDMFVEWGYSYQPCTDENCTDGVVSVAEF
jgi:hypothetical protein